MNRRIPYILYQKPYKLGRRLQRERRCVVETPRHAIALLVDIMNSSSFSSQTRKDTRRPPHAHDRRKTTRQWTHRIALQATRRVTGSHDRCSRYTRHLTAENVRSPRIRAGRPPSTSGVRGGCALVGRCGPSPRRRVPSAAHSWSATRGGSSFVVTLSA